MQCRDTAFRSNRNPVADQGALHQQRPPAILVALLGDLENKIRPVAGDFAREEPVALDPANLGHRALRTPVLVTDPEDDGVNESKGMIEHQALDLAVRSSAPMTARQKGPSDLDLTDLGRIAIVPARSDQPVCGAIDKRKAHFRSERAVEEFSKFRLGIAIRRGMNFPDLRIRTCRKQLGPIVCGYGADGDGGTDKRRLKIGLRHRARLASCPVDRKRKSVRLAQSTRATTASLRIPML